jgi:hypothetical protein
MTPEDVGGGPSAALRDALAAADSDGRLPPASARAVRAGLDLSGEDLSVGPWNPERLLGPFEALPTGVQRSLIRELEEYEQWRLRAYELGDWHVAAVRLLKSRGFRRLAGRFRKTSVLLLRDGPRMIFDATHGAAVRWKGRHASRPSVGSVLRAAGLDPRSLAVFYARGLAQPAGYRGFWRDATRNVTVGSILGVDLLPTADGFWYLESNLNPAMRPARTALYEKEDPFVVNLCRFAQEGGYRRLVVVLQSKEPLDRVMAGRYEKESAARKIQLTLLEDAYRRPSRYEQTLRMPESLEPDTLVVRLRLFRTNLDTVFHSKKGGHRALGIYQQRSGDRDVGLPPTSDEPLAGRYDATQPFPNVVYKMERDMGTGIAFLKASSLEHARELVIREIERRQPTGLSARLYARAYNLGEDPRGVFQPYIVGPMLEGRRLYFVRAHVLLTPVGAQYLSAHRTVSTTPVPLELPDGIVRDRKPYYWGYAAGNARYALLPPEEEPGVVKAVLGVARGLSAAAEYGFETRPAR